SAHGAGADDVRDDLLSGHFPPQPRGGAGGTRAAVALAGPFPVAFAVACRLEGGLCNRWAGQADAGGRWHGRTQAPAWQEEDPVPSGSGQAIRGRLAQGNGHRVSFLHSLRALRATSWIRYLAGKADSLSISSSSSLNLSKDRSESRSLPVFSSLSCSGSLKKPAAWDLANNASASSAYLCLARSRSILGSSESCWVAGRQRAYTTARVASWPGPSAGFAASDSAAATARRWSPIRARLTARS